jgi:spermidine synthase
MQWFFVFFFISGFCSILYEIVWLRLAMAQFGVTSALVAIVISVFMAGLGLGSWVSGRLITRYGERVRTPALRFYALTEMLIGMSAIAVPYQLMVGRDVLRGVALSSSSYYLASGVWIALTLVPWCACMGATIPIAMLAIRRNFPQDGSRSFSYLYVANVCGAVVGALLPPLLVELRGFHGTLRIGALLNLALAAAALVLSLRSPQPAPGAPADTSNLACQVSQPGGDTRLLALLFTTGLTSMGLEVVWIRQFTPYLGTAVYTFASILGLYLAATFAGSRVYRLKKTHVGQRDAPVWALLGLFALLPVLVADPYIHVSKVWRLVLGIVPFSGVLGFVTPQLVDRWSQGDPDRAGRAYAINVVGCILGPLLAGFVLLPMLSERWAMFVLAAPWLVIGAISSGGPEILRSRGSAGLRRWIPYAAIPGALAMVLTGKDYQDYFSRRQVLRDDTATVVATGEGMQRQLLVNGIGMTVLQPLPKMMAHLPLVFLDHPPKNALVVCFGMGTTYRSLLSWGIPTTVVELVPSVPRMFSYYHDDAQALVESPLSRIVIDDGRRFLERTREQYDVITLDPPPPIQAAGSSLLYSKEFYETAKQRLRPEGILQQWLPAGDAVVRASVTRALVESFGYVRAFHTGGSEAENPGGGFQFLASDRPLARWTAGEMAEHMPTRAQADLMEWSRLPRAEDEFARVLTKEVSPDELMVGAPWAPPLQDDRPENEYYALRRWLPAENWQYLAGPGSRLQTERPSGD